ncbi:DUF6686 family protein [Dyadobacter psychrotolerans]|uniref:Uncharacterized protein n=1 Tax=Dyadobacter psychrotolerans TaxID=2541721 RepID=A0A4R5DGZ6_9BACT|nr:DUF6686 family protein [Dyadobacter psychrotolerans]TDE12507.1 hypothetical protein E0F88_22715 [Dyadobacter psychrotolerans]
MHDDSHSYSTLRILSQSANGYIGRCNCCDHYNFVFGNFLFLFSEEGLNGFCSILYDKQHVHSLESPLPNGKNILFPSPIPNFMLSFTEEEIEEIKGLFQETLLALEIDRIFAHNK